MDFPEYFSVNTYVSTRELNAIRGIPAGHFEDTIYSGEQFCKTMDQLASEVERRFLDAGFRPADGVKEEDVEKEVSVRVYACHRTHDLESERETGCMLWDSFRMVLPKPPKIRP